MTLRTRLFLSLSAVVIALVLAQWWWVRSLTTDLSDELGFVAFEVGSSVAGLFSGENVFVKEDGTVDRGNVKSFVEDIHRKVRETHEAEGEASGEIRIELQVESEAEPSGESESSSMGPKKLKIKRKIQERKVIVLADSEEEIHVVPPIDSHAHAHTHDDDDEEHGRKLWLHREVRDGDVHYISLTGPNHMQRDIRVPSEGFRGKIDDFSQKLLLGSFGFLGFGLLLAGVVAHRTAEPLRRLAEGAREVGGGELGREIPVRAGGEVGEAISAFNLMSRRLAELDETNRRLSADRHLGEIGEIGRGLAHTLRNPLNALGLSVDELAARADDEETATLAASARRQIRRIDEAIRSFLVLAGSGGAAEPTRVGDLVHDVVLEALQDARGKARIEVEARDAAPIAAVEPELRAVVQALVVNAVEASQEGGEVEATVEQGDEGRVVVLVADRGPGLPESIREHLFTPHQTTKATGSGMGLFLAHRIATTRYAGNLRLDDREGGGTIARLEIGPRVDSEDL